MKLHRGIFPGLLLMAWSCTTGELTRPGNGPSASIVDGARGGNPHFYFLPPMVRMPVYSGSFDATLSPTVRVSGPGVDRELQVVLHATEQVYQAQWHTSDDALDPASSYRVTVLVGAQELGYADVDVVARGSELRNVDTGEFIALLNGRTLPIKFRIEQGAVVQPPATLDGFVFVRRFGGNGENDEIFSARADGSDPTRLTTNSEWDWTPALSPDRTKIAFSRGPDGAQMLWVMNFDGSDSRQLTFSGDAGDPSWSADGSQIFFSNVPSHFGGVGIFRIQADGSSLTPITSGTDLQPHLSPNGQRLLFARNVALHSTCWWDIFAINLDGTALNRLTVTSTGCGAGYTATPVWSPDGSRIVFSSQTTGLLQVYVMNPDGSGRVQLTYTGNNGHPTWSPDGSRILFQSDRNGDWDIFMMNADGTGQTCVVCGPTVDFLPSWRR